MTARNLILAAALFTISLANSALAGGYGPQAGGYGHGGHGRDWQPQPQFKIVYETRYRIEKVTKYREELCTTYVNEECKVPRQITKTEYKMVPEVICRTITEYKYEKVDKGSYQRQAYVDAWGCTKYKEVWCPNIVTIKVPCQREIKETIMKKVPYQVTCTVYETVVKKVPVTTKKMVPYVVECKVPYQVAKKVPCDPPRNPWKQASYGH